MVSKVQATNKYLTERGDGHLTSDHYVIGDIFLYVAYRELSPIAAFVLRSHHPSCDSSAPPNISAECVPSSCLTLSIAALILVAPTLSTARCVAFSSPSSPLTSDVDIDVT
eukprot:scaffold155275_cov66-Cyclotella_meneghiniana.AAC.4